MRARVCNKGKMAGLWRMSDTAERVEGRYLLRTARVRGHQTSVTEGAGDKAKKERA